MLFARGSSTTALTGDDLKRGLFSALDKLGEKRKVCAIPPDFSRYHSRAGELTRYAYEYYGERLTDILPAIGTHAPMSASEIEKMYPGVPVRLFREHDWRSGLTTLGEVPGAYIRDVSEGRLEFPWPAQLDRLIIDGGFDLVLSIGQVVPHEVIGMANYNKNIFVGTGGSEGINKSHFLGAVYGMERIMGHADTPVRRVLNYASDRFARHVPLVYVQTVIGRTDAGTLVPRGLFIDPGIDCFTAAAELSAGVNITMLDTDLATVVVFLDPGEFKSTWLGNKAIYRTRMAMADGGRLVVLAPGVREFGEDPAIDSLIRKYGYAGTPRVLELVEHTRDLRDNLSAAAHLIHGSSEGRFSITYCPGGLNEEEIRSAGFEYADLDEAVHRYDPAKLSEGWNETADGERIYYISNPAVGLWANRDRFQPDATGKN